MPTPPTDFPEDLFEDCLLALEAGDQSAVEQLLAKAPQHRAAIRERLDQLAALGLLQAPSPAPLPERLGEFRLLRQLGRGGMGVVHLAEQEGLGRQVALKLIHPEQRHFPGARERFRREVLAVARLQHPGIVPVLSGGEADGVPYYAMELVAGASLAEVLQELSGRDPRSLDGTQLRAGLQRAMAKKGDSTPLADAPVFHGAWPSVCCRLALEAAAALQHAHEHGVLHRDVKPSNLLLCASGSVRLIDFGLASASGETRITRSGAALGSMPYMSPEQVRGEVQAQDERTDVYALGVTLYELLTLTLPHGDGSGTTRERILAGMVELPQRRNPQVHPDLEAVCLRAMDVERKRRYASAAAFAGDLQAFLEHRTVMARRPSALLRVRRWAMRHPGRAGAIAVLFCLLVPAPLAIAVQQHRAAKEIAAALVATEQQRQLAVAAEQTAETMRRAAEHNLEQALAAVDQMLFRTAVDRLSRHPRTTALRRALLEDAVHFYQQMLASAPGDRDLLRVGLERARTEIRLARLLLELGQPPRAAELLEGAIVALEAAAPQLPKPVELQRELGLARLRLGVCYSHLDRLDELVVTTRAAVAHFAAAIAAAPGDAGLLDALLETRMALAMGLGRKLELPAAHAELDAVDAMLAQAPEAGLDEALQQSWARQRVLAAEQRGVLWTSGGDTEQAKQSFAAAVQHAEAMPTAWQQDDQVRSTRLSALERLSQICAQRREWQVALAHLDPAIEELERRVADDPEVVSWRARLAEMLGTRATCRRELRDVAVIDDHNRAVALLTKVIADAPAEPHQRRRLAIAHAERAGCHFMAGRQTEALADLEQAGVLFEALIAALPHDDVSRRNYAALLANHARTLAAGEQLETARSKAANAIDIVRQSRGGDHQRSLIELCALCADLAMQAHDVPEGQRWMGEAQQLVDAWLAERPEEALRQATASMIAANHGTQYLQLREHARAREIWENALPTARAAKDSSPFARQILAVILLRLADVAMRDQEVESARRWFAAGLAETGVRQAQMRPYPPLFALFDHPALRDLVPANPASR